MSWIKESEYDEYLTTLDPYLKQLGAAEKFSDPEVEDQVFVGMVKFPSGLWLQAKPYPEGPTLHLFGNLNLPFYGFEDAGDIACHTAQCFGYVARVDREHQTIEVWGPEPNDHYRAQYQYDRLVDVIRVVRASLATAGEPENQVA